MTPKHLREWLLQNSQPDQWWLSLDAVTEELPVTVSEVEARLNSGLYFQAQVLHVSQAGLANAPWIEVELSQPHRPQNLGRGKEAGEMKTGFSSDLATKTINAPLFKTKEVTVTNTHVDINGKTFFLRNIADVAVYKEEIEGESQTNAWGCLGLLVLLISTFWFFCALYNAIYEGSGYTSLIISIKVAVGGFILFISGHVPATSSYTYSLHFTTNAGSVKVFTGNHAELHAIKRHIVAAMTGGLV